MNEGGRHPRCGGREELRFGGSWKVGLKAVEGA